MTSKMEILEKNYSQNMSLKLFNVARIIYDVAEFESHVASCGFNKELLLLPKLVSFK